MSIFLEATANIPINPMIWGICIGINLAFLFTFIVRGVNGMIVRPLLSHIGAENAAALKDLDLKGLKLWFAKRLLRDNSTLRNTVSCVGGKIFQIPVENQATEGEKPIEPTFKYDYENTLFYIEKSKAEKARITYGKPSPWYIAVIFMVLSLGISYLATLAAPYVMSWFNF